MARRCPDWVAREDLVAAGMLGLTEAAERYDESRTEPFLAFAEHRIRGAMLDELRRGDMLPRRVRQVARKISNTSASSRTPARRRASSGSPTAWACRSSSTAAGCPTG
jgi:RNA polymerase sigma factor for flagellar operon FliA